jgi:hypothetical protein
MIYLYHPSGNARQRETGGTDMSHKLSLADAALASAVIIGAASVTNLDSAYAIPKPDKIVAADVNEPVC